MIIFVLGPSSCGKGTQADLLAEKYGIPHVSTGDLFRKEVADGTELGKQIAPILASGQFVPGEITFQILKEHVHANYEKFGGIIIDGFPRFYSQVEEIQPVVDECIASDNSWYRAIHFTLTFEECLRRQENRTASGVVRSDADESALRRRYDEYMKDIPIISEYYKTRGVWIEADANRTIEEIYKDITDQIDKSLENKN